MSIKFGNSFEWFDKHYNIYGYIDKRMNSVREYAYYATINGIWEHEFETYKEAEKACLNKLKEIIVELKLEQHGKLGKT